MTFLVPQLKHCLGLLGNYVLVSQECKLSVVLLLKTVRNSSGSEYLATYCCQCTKILKVLLNREICEAWRSRVWSILVR